MSMVCKHCYSDKTRLVISLTIILFILMIFLQIMRYILGIISHLICASITPSAGAASDKVFFDSLDSYFEKIPKAFRYCRNCHRIFKSD